MKWTIGTKIGGGFALALLALVAIGIISYRSTNGLIQTAAMVDHTHQVLQNLELILSTMKDGETGQRGYIITAKDSYLEPYTNAQEQIRQQIQHVRELTSDNSVRGPQLATLEDLVARKFQEMQSIIDIRNDPLKGFEPARLEVMTDKGKNLMDEIRKLVLTMENDENVLLKQRTDESTLSTEQTHTTIIWGTVVAFAFLFVTGFSITNNISKPINEMATAAEKIAVGDLSDSIAPYDRGDEVGDLSRTFAKMNGSLQDMAEVAKRIAASDLRVQVKPQSKQDVLGNAFLTMVDNLRSTTAELSEGVNVLASSASEIMASTAQMASSAAQTGTAISETTSTVEEVKQTAQISSQKAKFVSDNAQKAITVAQTGRKSVEASIEGMKRIQLQMESIAESVVKLSEQSQSIGEIIASVNDLAEQSNLLAVNAAIEAAKAGEQGKGFVVVAQEVKSLAEQSKQATAQVRTILNEIQKATTAAVLATEQGSKAVENGVKQSTEAGESIRQLSDTITEAAQAATQIAASSQQQLVGTDQVAMAMENIRQASSQNMAGTKQTETAAHSLHNLGQKMKQLVDQFKI